MAIRWRVRHQTHRVLREARKLVVHAAWFAMVLSSGACPTPVTDRRAADPLPSPDPGDEPSTDPEPDGVPYAREDVARADDATVPLGACPASSPRPHASDYVVPQALPWRESRARFPLAELSRARALNRDGLAARARGDAVAARAAYALALGASPRFAPARYNLACELARDRSGAGHEEAIQQLETLFVIGSREARTFAARARFDADFDCLRFDPRFVAMQASIRFDPRQVTGEQLCRDPARAADLIDPAKGVEIYAYYESFADAGENREVEKRQDGKEAFDQTLNWASGSNGEGDAPGECATARWDGSFASRALGAPKEAPVCQDIWAAGCAGFRESVCFVPTPAGWRISSLTHIGSSLASEAEARMQANVRRAVKAGRALFGISTP